MLHQMHYKELQELLKQYNLTSTGSGKNGRLLKIDLINTISPFYKEEVAFAPHSAAEEITEMDILSYLKQNDIIFMDGLDYVDLINLRKVNKRMTNYIDNNHLKMTLNSKNIFYKGNILKLLDNIYQSIRNELYKQHVNLNDRWINKEVYINTLERQIIKYYIHAIIYRIHKRRRKNLSVETGLPAPITMMNIQLKGTIPFNFIYVKIKMNLKVNKKMIQYISSIDLSGNSNNVRNAMYDLFFI